MTLSVIQTIKAVLPGAPAAFQGVGGVEPYVYAVTPGGAGGTIDAATGVYKTPLVASSNPKQQFDVITVTDDTAATASARILVGTPLLLMCDVIQTEMELADGRVYIWDQKLNQPTDNDLYIAVSLMQCRPYGNVNTPVVNGDDLNASQSVQMLARVDIDIISRGPAARDRKEEVLLALNSIYAQQQQAANSLFFARLPAIGTGFINLSEVDGAAIPYRYRITVNMQYTFTKVKAAPFYSQFDPVEVAADN